MKQQWNKKILWVLAFAILFFIGAVAFYWFSSTAHHSMESPNINQYHAQHLKPPEHGEVNMPGLQGEDITEKEINDLKTLFTQHEKITHTVKIFLMASKPSLRPPMSNYEKTLLICRHEGYPPVRRKKH